MKKVATGHRLDVVARIVIVVAASLFWLLMLAIVEGLMFWPFDPMTAGQKAGALALAASWVALPMVAVWFLRRRRA